MPGHGETTQIQAGGATIVSDLDAIHCQRVAEWTDVEGVSIERLIRHCRLKALLVMTVMRSLCWRSLPDDKILSPAEESSRRILSDQVKEILSDLSEKEREILECDTAGDGITHTLGEVGQKSGALACIRRGEAMRRSTAKIQQHIKIGQKHFREQHNLLICSRRPVGPRDVSKSVLFCLIFLAIALPKMV